MPNPNTTTTSTSDAQIPMNVYPISLRMERSVPASLVRHLGEVPIKRFLEDGSAVIDTIRTENIYIPRSEQPTTSSIDAAVLDVAASLEQEPTIAPQGEQPLDIKLGPVVEREG